MEFSDEQREEAYENISPEQKILYESWDSGLKLWDIAQKHNLVEPDIRTKFLVTAGDTILGLLKRTELPTVLSQALNISTEQAVKITGDLIDFLDQPETVGAPDGGLSSGIAKAEVALNNSPHIRTMSEDMAASQTDGEEVTYTSTQAAILKESQDIIPNNPPQWGSETK